MPSPVSSRETSLYTPTEPAKDVCTPDAAAAATTSDDDAGICSGEIESRVPTPICASHEKGAPGAHSPPAHPFHAQAELDYLTLSGGASAIIGGDVSVTLDRNGHLYLGLGAGVGISATVASASLHAGQLTEPPNSESRPEQLQHFLQGDCIQASAGIGAEVGITNGPTGTAAELGVGLPQAGAQFQHNWYVLDLPIKW
jgi:hypothetical protein